MSVSKKHMEWAASYLAANLSREDAADPERSITVQAFVDFFREFSPRFNSMRFAEAVRTRRSNPRPRRTARRKGLIRDVRFFRGHAGGVVGRATQGALDLARAEREMKKRGWVVTWEPDSDADLSWMDDDERSRPHEIFVAVLWDRDPTGHARAAGKAKILASLGGIVDADAAYARVVEAELASEALARG